ncbi:hypothetical protein I5S84_09760 [Pseudomonas putida]|uniref:Sialate O-acetylesterase domain-containing protein n=1 Tax=Pseudomonas putida TaxID=303 RepID=A0A6I6XRS9_PSEPU|nr:hypothetical protein [Pseudomonas putida]MBH3449132.1 hypothetical protein [Pseudomonas putida]QHG66760.1 hypothetical protein C2H86_21100 [Pseudomonas putida]
MAETPVSAMEGYAALLDAASRRSDLAAALLHLYVNGGVDTDVLTESGPVASIAKQADHYAQLLPNAAADLSKLVANGRVWAKISDAVLEVADGAQFWVAQAAPLTGQDLYRRVGASATFEGVSIAGAADVAAVNSRLIATGITKVPKGPLRNMWALQAGLRMPLRVDDFGNTQLRVGVDEMVRKLPSSPSSAKSFGDAGLVVGGRLLANPANIARALKRPRGPSLHDALIITAGPTVVSRIGDKTESKRLDDIVSTVVQDQLSAKQVRAWDDLSWISREVSGRIQVHESQTWRDLFPAADGFTDASPIATGSTVRFLSDRTTGAGGALTPHAKLKSGELIAEAPVLWHRQGTGQSLSLGSRGFMIGPDGKPLFEQGVYGEVFSKLPSPFKTRCLSFKGYGPRVYSGGSPVAVSALTDFEPLRERFEGGLLGETPMSGFSNGMNRYLNERGTGMRYLCSIAGIGGTAYAGLKKGTSTFTSLVNMMTAARQQAIARGMIYRVGPLSITHGESEPETTSQETYAGYMREWLNDYQAAAKALDASMPQPWCYLSQMNRGPGYMSFVTLAQLQMHETDPQFVLVTPKYHFRYHDTWHPYAEAYFKVGEYECRVERFRLRGQKFDCLRPVSVVCSGSTLTVTFSNTPAGDELTAGPVGALQINPLSTNPGNYGFALTDTTVSITAVTLLGTGNQVQLTLSGAPAAGSALNYALANSVYSRGCISDTDTRDISAFDGQPLNNWLVAFSKAITFN